MVVVHSDSGGGEGLFLVLKQLAVGRLDEDLFLIAATRRVRYIDDPERNQGRQGDKERGSNWRKLGNRDSRRRGPSPRRDPSMVDIYLIRLGVDDHVHD